MREERDSREGEAERLLARLAGALGLPVSAFTSEPGSDAIKGFAEINEAYLLTLVKTYLNVADPTARSRFIKALQIITDAG